MIQYYQFCWNPFQVNGYLLVNDENEGWLIDAGMENEKELTEFDEKLKELGVHLSRILLTHGHVDHVCGSGLLYRKYHLLPELHLDDHFLYQTADQQGKMFGLQTGRLPEVKPLQAGELSFGKHPVKALHLPGHSPGSLGFYIPENKWLFSGDVLFNQGIGRTDLPGGSYEQLISSIKNGITDLLEDDTDVFPGHGPKTTVGQEKINNPFLS